MGHLPWLPAPLNSPEIDIVFVLEVEVELSEPVGVHPGQAMS